MIISRRITGVIAITFAVALAVSYTIHNIYFNAYARQADARALTAEAHNAQVNLNQYIDRMAIEALDFAHWTDTWRFARGINPEYPDTLLTQRDLMRVHMDAALVLNLNGQLLHQVSLDNHYPTDAVHALLRPLITDITNEAYAGLVPVGGYMHAVACRAIRTSTGGGPVAGWVVFARQITPKALAEIQRSLNAETRIRLQVGEPSVDGDMRVGSMLVAYQPVISLLRSQPVMLEVRVPPVIQAYTAQANRWHLLASVLLGLVATATLWFLLNQQWLLRLQTLQHYVSDIKPDALPNTPLILTGSDELTSLAQDVNQLIERLRRHEQWWNRHAEEVRFSVEYYRSYFDDSPVGIYVVSPDGHYLDVNQAGIDLLGYPRDQLIGMTVFDVAIPEDHDACRQILSDEQQTPQESGLLHARCADGSVRCLAIRMVRMDDGRILGYGTDITELMSAREQAHTAEALYTTLFNQLPSGAAIFEAIRDESGTVADLRLLQVNTAFRRAYPGPVDDLIGQPITQCLKLVGREWLERCDQVLRTGAPLAVEEYTELARAWLRVTLFAIGGDQVVMIFMNTSRYHDAVAKAHASEQRLQRLADMSSDGVWDWDLSANSVYLSPSLLAIAGYKPGQLPTRMKPLADQLIHPDDRMSLHQAMEAVRHNRQVCSQTVRFVRADGVERWVLIRGAFEYSAEGVPQRLFGTVTDLTASRHAIAAARESSRRFREMMERVRMLAKIVNKNGMVTFVNDYLLEVTGYTRAELIGNCWYELCVPEPHRNWMAEAFGRGLQESDLPLSYQNPIITKDGRQREIVWDNTILRAEDGSLEGVASLGRDITDQLQLEARLRQAQKMEAVGQLAGGVAHDFNNILQVYTGYIGFILSRLKEDEWPYQEMLMLNDATERAAALVRQLLTFSRQDQTHREPVDLESIVRGFLKMLRRVIGEQVEIRVDAPEPLPVVMADPGQIEQMLMNLCVNARDAMPCGGQITISLREEVMPQATWRADDAPVGAPAVCMRVSDTGHGIPPEIVNRLCDPFFTTKEVGKGTGLGLATVYGIVVQHQGALTVDSAPGLGATFAVYLPVTVNQSEQNDNQSTHGSSVMARSGDVLVAEDEQIVRDLICQVLKDAGYRVYEATDGAEAIQMLEQLANTLDVVLLDAVMPRQGGRAVYERARELRPDLPVLFMTGYSFSPLDGEQIAYGEVAVLQKPFTADELLTEIDAVMRRSAESQQS